jgi:integrase
MVLLATFASLRFGELAALRRGDLDLDVGTVTVFRSMAQMNDGSLIEADPKSRASRRVVAIPPEIIPELRWHLERFAEPDESGYVFVGPMGGHLRRNNFRVLWAKACQDAGLPGVHFHDLRHTGNTLAAATGASLRELMERMGHSSSRAALIYQHASKDRDKAIAKAVGEMFATARKQAKPGGRSDAPMFVKRPACADRLGWSGPGRGGGRGSA